MLREKEGEMEKESILHMFHEHPLSLIPNPAAETDYSWSCNWCNGCWRYFLPGEAAYGCSQKCGFGEVLHKECMEMPREIRHPLHPSHSLTLQRSLDDNTSKCAVCEEYVYGMYYQCSEGCELLIELACAGGFDTPVVDDSTMKHPSHPQHQLIKNTRSCSFTCDACGATHKGKSYICTICDYWIHENCALLSESAHFHHHRPDHSLSLAFHTPYEYIKYDFVCEICSGPLPMRRWVYHCQLCRYVVHINCASLPPSNSLNTEPAVDGEKGITKGPIDDIYEEIIRPFVKRERGQSFILHDHDNQNIHGSYGFPNHPHHHLLSFTTFSSSSFFSSQIHNQEEEDDDDDDDEDIGIPRLELTCDGCTLPIHEKKQRDDDGHENGYMSCDECKYFLHLSCFNLPPHLPSLPLHPFQDHKLTLQNAGKLAYYWAYCNICKGYTNGFYYTCTECGFTVDIKCASLPNIIKHVAHPRHNLHLNLAKDNRWYNFCGVCYDYISPRDVFYRCNSCKFCMCGKCVLLPAQNKHRSEKHRLWLTYDAYVNHPGEFYCSSCEVKMNPKRRMYYCRDCDQSFHPGCIPARSGQYRNINYGMQQYVIPTLHHHPLRFQIITKKKRCDRCRDDHYDKPGFQCVSCYFVTCRYCGISHMD